MRGHWLKWVLVTSAIGLCLVLVAFELLVFDAGGERKIRLIRQSRSPDGELFAEVREVIEPMHGGSDSVEVLIRRATDAWGSPVYEQTFECGPDYDAFQLVWESPTRLAVEYGTCDLGRNASPTDNAVLHKSASWDDVEIIYRDSRHVAHSKLPPSQHSPQ